MSTNLLNALIGLRRALARAVTAAFTGELSGRQAAILRELHASGPLSQVGLARATVSDPSFMVRLLDDLEKRGLVSRQRSEEDRRERVVSLTPRGRKALGPIELAFQELANAAESALTIEEQETFIALASKISHSLTAAATRSSASPEGRHERR